LLTNKFKCFRFVTSVATHGTILVPSLKRIFLHRHPTNFPASVIPYIPYSIPTTNMRTHMSYPLIYPTYPFHLSPALLSSPPPQRHRGPRPAGSRAVARRGWATWSRAAARRWRQGRCGSSRGDRRRASSSGQRRLDPAAPILSSGLVLKRLVLSAMLRPLLVSLPSARCVGQIRRGEVLATRGPCPAASLPPDDKLSALAWRPPCRFLLHCLCEPGSAAPPLLPAVVGDGAWSRGPDTYRPFRTALCMGFERGSATVPHHLPLPGRGGGIGAP
jgi:hypothetical protein